MNFIIFVITILSVTLAIDVTADEKLRVVSLTPIITEIISELDQEEVLVGKTAFCALKNKNLEVPSVGSYLDTSIEGIFSLKPDIVLLSKEQGATAAKLAKLGIKSIKISNQTIEGINQAIITIANALNVSERGVELVSSKKQQVESIKKLCNDKNKAKRAIFIFDEGNNESRKKYFIASQSSFFTEIMKMSELENLFKSDHEYAEVSIEGIYSLKPEIIFLVTETKEPEKTLSFLTDVLNLGENQKIVLLPKEPTVFPGPRYPEILKSFACNSNYDIESK